MAGGRRERRTDLAMPEDARETCIGKHLVGRHDEGRRTRFPEEPHDCRQVLDGEQQHGCALRSSCELERGSGDDPEGPFAADEELPEVQTGIVFFECTIDLENFAARQYDLKSQDPLAGQPPPDHPDAAGVRRDVAAPPCSTLSRRNRPARSGRAAQRARARPG
jgi:hypothetical protein